MCLLVYIKKENALYFKFCLKNNMCFLTQQSATNPLAHLPRASQNTRGQAKMILLAHVGKWHYAHFIVR